MPRVLKKIANAQDDISKLNQNFDNISLDIADRSGVFSSVASGGFTIGSNVTATLEVSVLDASTQSIYVKDLLPVIPRITVYIDADGVGDNLWPAGTNITSTMRNAITIDWFVSRQVVNPVDTEKATFYIVFRNTDAVSHTFYISTDAYYVPGPDLGIAQRGQ